MHPGFSIYLDLIRFSAAIEVLLSHLGPVFGWHGLGVAYGHEAVVVFFVLSGYVISYAATVKDRTFGIFAVSRFTRIYSVAIPALLLTLILDHVGSSFSSATYEQSSSHYAVRFLISLFLFNEGWWSVQAFSNGPFWSVCYELDYYLVFSCLLFLSGRTRILASIAAVLLVGLRPILLFPIWLFGSWAYFETASRRRSRVLHWSLFLLPLPAFWLYAAYSFNVQSNDIVQQCLGWLGVSYDLGSSRHLLSDHYLGLVLALHFVGAKNLGPELRFVFGRAAVLIQTLAGYTFTLYMVHMPILLTLSLIIDVKKVWAAPVVVAAIAAVTAIMGYLTETSATGSGHCWRGN
jgi:peptidoglycan/LPS O-acetylase OafA/YrhL